MGKNFLNTGLGGLRGFVGFVEFIELIGFIGFIEFVGLLGGKKADGCGGTLKPIYLLPIVNLSSICIHPLGFGGLCQSLVETDE